MGVYGTTIITDATPVVNGTSGRILYNNSNAVGEFGTWDGTTLTITGSVEALPGGMGRGILNAAYGTSRAFEAVYDAGTYWGILQMAAGNNAFGVYNEFVKTRSTNGTTMAAVSTNDTVMVLNSYADSGTAIPFVARLYTSVTGAVGGTNWPGMFGVRLGTGSGTADHTFTPTVFTSPGSVVATTTMTTGAASGTTGAVLFKGTTSGTVTLSVADAAGTYTLKLPTTDGNAGEFLQTDGSGNTTWAVAGSGGLTVGTTTITSGTNGRILYDNSGVLGEATVTGTLGSVVLSTAPTLTGPVTISEAVGSSGLTITGATQTTSQPALNITQTWNAVGTTFTGFKHTITDTASATESLIFQYLVGASNRLALRKNGTLRLISVGTASNAFTDSDKCLEFGTEGDSGYSALVAGQYNVLYHVAATPTTAGAGIRSGTFIANGEGTGGAASGANAGVARLGASQDGQGLALYSTGFVRWNSSTTDAYNNGDLFLYRDAANILALRNSTNAQTFRVYNTYTNSSNGEWLSMSWSTVSNNMYIRTEKNGTGTARVMHLAHSGNSAAVSIGTTVNAAGALSLIGNNLGTATASSGILDISPSGATATSGTLVIASVRPTVTPTSTSTLTFIPFQISPTINYSNATPGAGSYEALKIAVTETALPTGTNYLIRASAGAAGTTDKFTVSNGGNVVAAGTLQIADTKILKSTTSFSDGAGANTATLTNAPAATNPTKWIPIDDNGTTRYIPAW